MLKNRKNKKEENGNAQRGYFGFNECVNGSGRCRKKSHDNEKRLPLYGAPKGNMFLSCPFFFFAVLFLFNNTSRDGGALVDHDRDAGGVDKPCAGKLPVVCRQRAVSGLESNYRGSGGG